MKKSVFLLFISLFINLSCQTNFNPDVEKKVLNGLSGPFGDDSFISIVECAEDSLELSSGKAYYLSLTGSDSSDGSEENPFKTFEYALSKLSAGDILWVEDGKYSEKINLSSSLKGSEAAYITIAAKNIRAENKVIISGAEISDDDFCLCRITGASYIRISGITFEDSYGLDAAGIIVSPPSSHIIIDSCTFTNIKVLDPAIEDHVANAISCFGDSTASINNILIYNNSCTNLATGWGECISVTGNCENINIIKNYVDDTGNIGIDVGGNYGYCKNAVLDFARYVYIYNNTVKNCESAYGDTSYGIYADGGQHIQILNNKVSSCSGGIEIGAEEPQKSVNYATCDVLVKGNEVSDCQECALAVGGYEKKRGLVAGVSVVNNTFTDNADYEGGAIIAMSKSNEVSITNNSFINSTAFKGEFLYKSLNDKYIKNLTVKDNTFSGIEGAEY